MGSFLIVALGGGIGAALRHGMNLLTLRWFGPNFPYGTLTVNVAGSLIMGLFIGWLLRYNPGTSAGLRLFVATGILGGFTTFSAFSLDMALLWEKGAVQLALLYVVLSVLLSILAVFAGLAIARSVGA
ncbi:fluoride efflux transporter CrcB [Pannonibacter sp. Q-1]|uniref:fluoride efflux transporter CrcB n=1 Tax=unclassified Pannonibacter TaxID=2627228 RepID=UPI0013A599D9|nr:MULTISPECIES: fluoride efflux transporter CrcB [unclassified Pannonibacter]